MVKEQLLRLLEEERGIYRSGEEVAERLGVSRAAVWKAAKALQKEGYAIEAVQGRGYCLAAGCDVLSAEGVKKFLHAEGLRIEAVACTSSTNAVVRERAERGEAAGLVYIAGEQTAGRGRLERSFYSPAGTGLYMSLLLRPQQLTAVQAVRVTTAAAVAVCEAVEAVTGVPAGIKWVNDVFAGGKKVCGILTEGAYSFENNSMRYIVLGVGINLYEPQGGFPPPLADIAGALLPAPIEEGKNRLAAAFLDAFYGYYSALDRGDHLAKYKQRSLAIGREVEVVSARGRRRALALDLDDDCHLRVRYEGGEEEWLNSGEISIRCV